MRIEKVLAEKSAAWNGPSHTIPGFFTQYDHPILEDGIRLVDMICLKKRLSAPHQP